MWRSIAAVSSRRFTRIRNHKVFSSLTLTLPHSQSPPQFLPSQSTVHSHYQIPRYFSQFSANPREESSVLSETELSSREFDVPEVAYQSDDTVFEGNGVDGLTPVGTIDVVEEGIQVSVDENESFVEEEVNEIDLEKLEGVLSLLQSSIDGSIESTFDQLGLDLHPDFVVKVLETPHLLGQNVIAFFKWAMKEKGFKVTTHVAEAFTKAICCELRKGNAYALWDFLKEIGEKDNSVLNADILNDLIALLSKLGKAKAALEVFDKFGDLGCTPNAGTYYFTIEALARRSFSEWAWDICEKMLNRGTLPDSARVGKIISWLCEGSKAKEAYSVYTFARESKTIPPRSSVNFLINSLCEKDDTIKLALEMLDDFTEESRKRESKAFSSVIRGLCRMKNVDEARNLLLKMISEGPLPGNAIFNSIINGYSKAGDMNEAKEIMKLMDSRGLKPDVFTYTVVISGYVKGGQMEEACEILSEAKNKHSKLTTVTYHTLIRGYIKLEEYDKALDLFNEMEKFGVQPNVDEYNKLIQSLCLNALDPETAEKLLEEMKEKGLHLNAITQGLISAVKELKEEGAEDIKLVASC